MPQSKHPLFWTEINEHLDTIHISGYNNMIFTIRYNEDHVNEKEGFVCSVHQEGREGVKRVKGIGPHHSSVDLAKKNATEFLAEKYFNTDPFQIDKAEQQLTGWASHRGGDDIHALISSMGLALSEWKVMRANYDLSYLSMGDIFGIENYLNAHEGNVA